THVLVRAARDAHPHPGPTGRARVAGIARSGADVGARVGADALRGGADQSAAVPVRTGPTPVHRMPRGAESTPRPLSAVGARLAPVSVWGTRQTGPRGWGRGDRSTVQCRPCGRHGPLRGHPRS